MSTMFEVILLSLFPVLYTSGVSALTLTTCDASEALNAFNDCIDSTSQDTLAVCACVKDFNEAARRCSLPVAVDGIRLWLWLATSGADDKWETADLPSIQGGTVTVQATYATWEHLDNLLNALAVTESLCAVPGASLERCDASERANTFRAHFLNTCLDGAHQDAGTACACVKSANEEARRCSLPFAVDGIRLWLWLSATPKAAEKWESTDLPSIQGGFAKVNAMHDTWERVDHFLKTLAVAESLCAEPGASLAKCDAAERARAFFTCLDSASQDAGAVCACVKDGHEAARRCALPFAVDGIRFFVWLSTPGASQNWDSAALPSIRGGTAKVDTIHDAWEHTSSFLKTLTVAESLCEEPGASLAICDSSERANAFNTCLDGAGQDAVALCACVNDIKEEARRCSLPFAVDGLRIWLWLSATPEAAEKWESTDLPSIQGGTAKANVMHDDWEHVNSFLKTLPIAELLCSKPGASLLQPRDSLESTVDFAQRSSIVMVAAAVIAWLAAVAWS